MNLEQKYSKKLKRDLGPKANQIFPQKLNERFRSVSLSGRPSTLRRLRQILFLLLELNGSLNPNQKKKSQQSIEKSGRKARRKRSRKSKKKLKKSSRRSTRLALRPQQQLSATLEKKKPQYGFKSSSEAIRLGSMFALKIKRLRIHASQCPILPQEKLHSAPKPPQSE